MLRKHGDALGGKYLVAGQTKHFLYSTYTGMKNRCYTKSHKMYAYYGGRGIKVCERWLGQNGFNNFVKDMGDKPTRQHTLDRINSDGDYEPENCKWSTRWEQSNNRRNNGEIVGVYYIKQANQWRGQLVINKVKYAKQFGTKEEAISYRKRLEKELI